MTHLTLLNAGRLVWAPWDEQHTKWVLGTVMEACPEGEEFVDVMWEDGVRGVVSRCICVPVYNGGVE